MKCMYGMNEIPEFCFFSHLCFFVVVFVFPIFSSRNVCSSGLL